MFDQIVEWLEQYPYLGVAAVFLLCGMGLPVPEELVLLAAGYVCAKFEVNLGIMMVWCGGAIVVGDVLPYVLGRVFGTRLLRLRWMRFLVTKRRLAVFDLWFRRRGDLVILIARFIAGLRVVAFFTAGVMKMPWRRFLLYDGMGILVVVPLLTWLGHRSQAFIDEMIVNVQKVERGIVWTAIAGTVIVVLSFWWWRRRGRRLARRGVGEAYVQPSRPVAAESDDGAATAADGQGAADGAIEPGVTRSAEEPTELPTEQPTELPGAESGSAPADPRPDAAPEPADDPVPPTSRRDS
ncbi:MAG: VTT domain-containing protein [Planctomycetes bacterium]|nr:VTT domain-containing protein [Planctomycetota bacterium]